MASLGGVAQLPDVAVTELQHSRWAGSNTWVRPSAERVRFEVESSLYDSEPMPVVPPVYIR